ncbi:MAG: DUF4215 domain-containing protein [Myxococcaceae bacterium]|nr:DUF4215 domain-containing protein [Myxococcaceae bacterium]
MTIHRLGLLLVTLFVCSGCPGRHDPVCGDGKVAGSEACDDGNQINGDGCENDCTVTGTSARCGDMHVDASEACDDGNQINGDGCENDCTVTGTSARCGDMHVDANEACDDGNQVNGDGCENNCTVTHAQVVTCPHANMPAPAMGTCNVTPGGTEKLFTGVVLAPSQVLLGGQVLVDANGKITCVACDCSQAEGAAAATQVQCPKGVISPGLINSHDHISFQSAPQPRTDERYEHRHDWRVRDHDGHTQISSGGSSSAAMIHWGELRQVMAGTTSIVGATYGANSNAGLLRNLDSSGGQEGLNEGAKGVLSETFPLSDQSGAEIVSGCGYPSVDTPSVIPPDSAYLPHIAEGIEASALNEFRCLSSTMGGGQDVMTPRTGVVHGIALRAADVGTMATHQASLVWSPRSNVSLYGDTAAVPLYQRLGVKVALGTDWTISGSMNLLRELKCADSLNQTRFAAVMSDEALWKTVTASAADVTQTAEKIGRLEVGKVADLAIFKQQGTTTHRSVIDANAEDVVLTLRGGKALYGDVNVVNALAAGCDALDVCGSAKAACVQSELNTTLAALDTASANARRYPLFFCGAPTNEPSCVPERAASNVKNGSTPYTVATATGDADFDGIADAQDNCPHIFNPIRPMDNGKQADADTDGIGDVCDACPFNMGEGCTLFNPDDSDGDGKVNAQDNCPSEANPSQTDSDMDGTGDACDSCAAPNPGGTPCPSTIYAVKAPNSPLLNQHVSLGQVLVTGITDTGFFVQVHPGEGGFTSAEYSGIFVYKPMPGVAVGDRVDIEDATPVDYFGQRELSNVTNVTVSSTGNAAPAPVVVTAAEVVNGGSKAVTHEAVVVQVNNVSVTNLSPALGAGDRAPANEFEVTGGLRVDDLLFLLTPAPALGQTFAALSGILTYRNNNNKLEPRSAADVLEGPAILTGFSPSPAFIFQGQTGTTVPTPLSVTISHPETANVTVNVVADSADVTVANGGMVTILAGATSAPLTLTGVNANPMVTLTATLGPSMKTATVRVVGPAETPKLVSLTPATGSVLPGGMLTLTATLDLPAPTDTVVTLALSPATGFGAVPAMVTIPANQVSATFILAADPMAMGMGTVSATLGAATLTSQVGVQLVTTQHLVLSEVAVKGPGGASDEFVELYNPTAAPIDISLWKIQYKSAAGAFYADKVTLPINTVVPPRSYFLVVGAGYVGAVAGDHVYGQPLAFAGDSGHVRIGFPNMSTAKADTNVVDWVGYGTAADSPEGTSKAPAVAAGNIAESIERKALPSSTSMTMGPMGADAFKGNGYDSDNSGENWVVRSVREPQNAASPVEP